MRLMMLYPEYNETRNAQKQQSQKQINFENKLFEINGKLKPVPLYVQEIINNIIK